MTEKQDRGTSGAPTIGNLAYSVQPAWRPTRLPAVTRTEAIAYLSAAFDLAESQPPGHAARVAYLALGVAERLGLDEGTKHRTLLAALLHDSGIAVRSLPPGTEGRGGHTAAGAWVAAKFGLDNDVQRVIRCSHERWDGTGRPLGLADEAIPTEALAVIAAHWASDESDNLDNLLLARARLRRHSVAALHPVMGPHVAEALHDLLSEDATWIALSDRQLPALLSTIHTGEEPAPEALEAVARVFGDIVDAAAREPGRSEQVATLAVELGRLAGMPAAMLRALRVAGELLDLGLLGVPRHITEKPAILTVQEMETMQRHASSSARTVEALPGMDIIAHWIEAHHERMDGRGYPEMLEGEDIPLPARILAVADAYCALRAERPYRPAFATEDALEIIEDGAGTQFDAAVVEMLRDALHGADRAVA